MIEIRHLRKSYPNATPIKDISTTINDGDIISIIGPSGTGKSTFIRCLNMLDTPTSGQILIDGEDITSPKCNISEIRKKVGMVFQSFNLFSHLTVIENLMLGPMELLHKSRKEAYAIAMKYLKSVGMDTRALNYPDMLSGGQKQRVAIARTLCMNPEIILFDEPTSALDPTMIGEVQAVIRQLAKEGHTMMIVTHEMKFAREICNRVFYLDQGGIYEEGTPEDIFDHPQKELTRRFIHHLKVYERDIDSSTSFFPEVDMEIEEYGNKNRIPSKIMYRIHAVFEELCQQILMPEFGKIKKIHFSVEYDESCSCAKIVVSYGGSVFDPHNSENTLSVAILENISESFVHKVVNELDYTNKVTILIK